MFNLRLIKVLVPGVVILYMYQRRLPFLIESLAIHSITGRPPDRSDAVERGDMTLQERFVAMTVVFLYLLLPHWIRLPW